MSKMDTMDQYQAAVDEAIALCDGDVRGALAALLAANEYLETLLSTVGIMPQVGAAKLQ